MSKQEKSRKELIEEINEAGRRWSTATVIFHQTVAEQAGLSGSDHKYLDLLVREGSMPAGRLAELTGLTTGAVTGVIDRLEKRGLVKRRNDPGDRRKVLIELQADKAEELIAPVFAALQKELVEFHKRFSNEELSLIRRYLSEISDFFQRETQKLTVE